MASKDREDRKAVANSKGKQGLRIATANKLNGYREATAKVDSKSKDNSDLTENKGRVAAKLEYKAAHLIAQRWFVCVKTLNLEIACVIV